VNGQRQKENRYWDVLIAVALGAFGGLMVYAFEQIPMRTTEEKAPLQIVACVLPGAGPQVAFREQEGIRAVIDDLGFVAKNLQGKIEVRHWYKPGEVCFTEEIQEAPTMESEPVPKPTPREETFASK
jgi:hypothetical protein